MHGISIRQSYSFVNNSEESMQLLFYSKYQSEIKMRCRLNCKSQTQDIKASMGKIFLIENKTDYYGNVA